MESGLSLSFCPSSPAKPPRIPPIASLKRATKLRSNHKSLPLSSGFTRLKLGQVLINPVICVHDHRTSAPWKINDRGDNKIVRGTLGVSLVLACALGIMSCSSKMNPKAIAAGPKEMFQKAPPVSALAAYPIGGRRALESFLAVSAALASSKAEPFYLPRYPVPPGPSMEDVNAFKMEAVRQMKSGKPDLALALLRKVYESCKNEPEPAYHAEMALVEILIYQGKYEEALNCNCLKDEQRIPSDGRFPFYKAIIYTMLKEEKAKMWWEEFARTVQEEFERRDVSNYMSD